MAQSARVIRKRRLGTEGDVPSGVDAAEAAQPAEDLDERGRRLSALPGWEDFTSRLEAAIAANPELERRMEASLQWEVR
jgi:hypothetical protein